MSGLSFREALGVACVGTAMGVLVTLVVLAAIYAAARVLHQSRGERCCRHCGHRWWYDPRDCTDRGALAQVEAELDEILTHHIRTKHPSAARQVRP